MDENAKVVGHGRGVMRYSFFRLHKESEFVSGDNKRRKEKSGGNKKSEFYNLSNTHDSLLRDADVQQKCDHS